MKKLLMLSLVLLTPAFTMTQDTKNQKPAAAVPEKSEKSTPGAKETPVPATPQKQAEQKKPAEKPVTLEPKAVAVKPVATKEVTAKTAQPAQTAVTAAFYQKAADIQKKVHDFALEAEKFAKQFPDETEKVLEQLGIIMGISIAGLEEISGEKLIDFEALEAEAEAAAKKEQEAKKPAQAKK